MREERGIGGSTSSANVVDSAPVIRGGQDEEFCNPKASDAGDRLC